MYLFYFDESGSRDSQWRKGKNDHVYVLLAVGIHERQWRKFDHEITHLKLELADYLKRDKMLDFPLDQCEIKSHWLRNPKARTQDSHFLHALDPDDRARISNTYFEQVKKRQAVILASIIDKRCLPAKMAGGQMHEMAYEFLMERIQHYMRDNKPNQQTIIIMDDLSKELNRDMTLNHAAFQRRGNRNMSFPSIIEYPFFVRSELSNGVQLADLLAYTVFHAFTYDKPDYEWLDRILPQFYRKSTREIQGLKVWAKDSELMAIKRHIMRRLATGQHKSAKKQSM